MTPKRHSVLKARLRVMVETYRVGHITNKRAKEIGRWNQAWYHLNQMAEDGILKQDGYNRWTLLKPGVRWYRETRDQLNRQLQS